MADNNWQSNWQQQQQTQELNRINSNLNNLNNQMLINNISKSANYNGSYNNGYIGSGGGSEITDAQFFKVCKITALAWTCIAIICYLSGIDDWMNFFMLTGPATFIIGLITAPFWFYSTKLFSSTTKLTVLVSPIYVVICALSLLAVHPFLLSVFLCAPVSYFHYKMYTKYKLEIEEDLKKLKAEELQQKAKLAEEKEKEKLRLIEEERVRSYKAGESLRKQKDEKFWSEIPSQLDSKEGTFQVVKSVLENAGQSVTGNVSQLITQEIKKEMINRLFIGFRVKKVNLDREYSDVELVSYSSGMIANWLRKDDRLNGIRMLEAIQPVNVDTKNPYSKPKTLLIALEYFMDQALVTNGLPLRNKILSDEIPAKLIDDLKSQLTDLSLARNIENEKIHRILRSMPNTAKDRIQHYISDYVDDFIDKKIRKNPNTPRPAQVNVVSKSKQLKTMKDLLTTLKNPADIAIMKNEIKKFEDAMGNTQTNAPKGDVTKAPVDLENSILKNLEKSLAGMVGMTSIKSSLAFDLTEFIQSKQSRGKIFWGNSGVGKTEFAQRLSGLREGYPKLDIGRGEVHYISGVDGKLEIKELVDRIPPGSVVFIDEADKCLDPLSGVDRSEATQLHHALVTHFSRKSIYWIFLGTFSGSRGAGNLTYQLLVDSLGKELASRLDFVDWKFPIWNTELLLNAVKPLLNKRGLNYEDDAVSALVTYCLATDGGVRAFDNHDQSLKRRLRSKGTEKESLTVTKSIVDSYLAELGSKHAA